MHKGYEQEQAEIIRLRVQSLMVKVMDKVDDGYGLAAASFEIQALAAAYESLVTATAMMPADEDKP